MDSAYLPLNFYTMRYGMMLLAGLILSSFQLLGQECQFKRDVDEFSGKPKVSTGFFTLAQGMLSVDATAAEMDFFFVVKPAKGPACFDDESTLIFLFEGGKQKTNGRYAGDANCQGVFHFIIKTGNISPSSLQKLSTQKVISILFKGKNEVEYPVTLTPAESQKLMESAQCIWAESKKLSK
jgi:hypothetical protein